MIEEDLPLDEQVKKKKRFILVVLLSMLLVSGLTTLPLLGGPLPPATAVAEAASPTPTATQPATKSAGQPSSESETTPASRITSTATQPVTKSADQSSPESETTSANPVTPTTGNLSPETPTTAQATTAPDTLTTPAFETTPSAKMTESSVLTAPTATVSSSAEVAQETSTMVASPAGSQSDEWSGAGTPPVSGSGEFTSDEAATITVTVTEGVDTLGANTTPSTPIEPDQVAVTLTVTIGSDGAPETEKTPSLTSDETPATSVPTGESLTTTLLLTNTPIVTQSLTQVPPNGLPITGIPIRRGPNWAALGLLVLLLGAGFAALLQSKIEK